MLLVIRWPLQGRIAREVCMKDVITSLCLPLAKNISVLFAILDLEDQFLQNVATSFVIAVLPSQSKGRKLHLTLTSNINFPNHDM